MLKYITPDCNLYHQKDNVKNFDYRNAKLYPLGAWRWLAVYQYRHVIASYVFSNKKGIDFGGYGAPIWGNTEIVDIEPPNRWRQLKDIGDEELDYIFTSHTLEHIKNLEETLQEFCRILKSDGIIIGILPSYMCERWRAGDERNDHVWTFSIGKEFTNIRNILIKYFDVESCRYAYDDSIFFLARKSKN